MKEFDNYSLLKHNTFGIDVKCRKFIEFETEEELQKIIPQTQGQPTLVLGGGSKMLFTKDYDGIVLHSGIKGIKLLDKESISGAKENDCNTGGTRDMNDSIDCGADGVNCQLSIVNCQLPVRALVGSGEVMDEAIEYFISQGWYGAENLSLIPGSVGAAAVQNIGAYGTEAKDIIYSVEGIRRSDGKKLILSNEECHFAYRHSIFKEELKDFVITAVVFQLSTEFTPRLDYGNLRQVMEGRELTAANVREAVIETRRSKLPDTDVLGSVGSFFVNPVVERQQYLNIAEQYPGMPHYEIDDNHVKIPAGWLIEQCGWKGKSLGRAGVYEKQALVIVNRGGATGEEIVNLAKTITNDVKNKFGISLNPETIIIGN